MATKMTVVALLAATLAGCSDATPNAEPTEAMAMEMESKSAKGTGTVTEVDADAGTVTIAHEPMPDIGWSAMTMTFNADPALLEGVAEGDKVAFDLEVRDNAGSITALSTQ